MKKYQAILFDLDGTLIDTSGDVLAAFNTLMRRYELPEREWDDVVGLIAKGSRALVELGTRDQSLTIPAEQLQKELIALRQKHLVEHSKPFPGIPNLLNRLNQMQIKWGVVSNNHHNIIEKIMAHFKLKPGCQCVVGSDDVPHMKPAPDALFKGCSIININTDQCLYVGDFSTDIEAANAADMDSVVAGYGYIDPETNPKNWGANFIAHTVEHLENYIFQ